MIFDQPTLAKLEQLSLIATRVRVGMMKGDRRSRKRGTSIEFADYRDYTKGDDLRRLDWNVYARLEKPFIKLLEEEEDLALHVLVDTSDSMGWPDESEETKLSYATKLAGALSYIGLVTGDRTSVTLLNANGNQGWGPSRGKQNGMRLLQFLEGTAHSGTTHLDNALKKYALTGGRPGLLFLVTDLLSPDGYQTGINALLARGYEIGIIHILSPDEIEPPLAGDVKLVDVETGVEAEISLDAATLKLYRERFEAWQTETADFCAARHIHYIPVNTEQPWDQLILKTLRTKGVLS